MDKAAAIDTITTIVRTDPGVRALFLGGSYGWGVEDAYSDLDFVAICDDGANDAFSALWLRAVGSADPVVLWWDRHIPNLINAVTQHWLRVDVSIHTPDRMRSLSRTGLRTLFDPDRLRDTLDILPSTPPTDLKRLQWQFEEFIRVLGLLSVVMGRQEYLNSITGIFHLRNLLTSLLIEETKAPHRGGALHLNRLITDEQKALLASLPVPPPEREAIIAAHLAYARAFIPRARALAGRLGLDWPQHFEDATWTHLERNVGLIRPDEIA